MSVHRSILFRGLVLLIVPMLFQIALIVMIFGIRFETYDSSDQAYRTLRIIGRSDEPWSALLAASGNLRAFVLTRDIGFATDASNAIATLRRENIELKAMIRNAEMLSRFEELQRRFEDAAGWIESMLELGRRGDFERVRQKIQAREGASHLAHVKAGLDDFQHGEEALLDERYTELHSRWRRLDQLLLIGILVLLSSTTFLAYTFARTLGFRVGVLSRNIHRLAEGADLEPPLRGGDELVELDHAFRTMAGTLRAASDKERIYREMLEDRAEQLASLNRELEHKNRENEMFVYSVSHDLRSPLVNLQGFSQELAVAGAELGSLLNDPSISDHVRVNAKRLIEDDVGESIHYIQQAVLRLSGIIDALLRLSRAGRVEYHPRQVDIEAIARRIHDALKGSLSDRSATLEIGRLPTAWGDPTAIEQVFANIIINAVMYLDPNRPGRIEMFDAGRENGFVRFGIRDNGLGIPKAYQEKIFAAFQRLHEGNAPGEGIGLTLVRRVIERLHGRIWVESQEGVGSTFYIALPSEAPSSANKESLPEIQHGLEVSPYSSSQEIRS